MTEYPKVNVALFDEILQFYYKGSVGMAVSKLRTLHQIGGYMMSDHNLVSRFTFINLLLNEFQTTTMLLVEISKGQQLSIVHDSTKIANHLFGVICLI